MKLGLVEKEGEAGRDCSPAKDGIECGVKDRGHGEAGDVRFLEGVTKHFEAAFGPILLANHQPRSSRLLAAMEPIATKKWRLNNFALDRHLPAIPFMPCTRGCALLLLGKDLDA